MWKSAFTVCYWPFGSISITIECTLTDRGRDRLTAAGLFITLLLVYNSNGREIGSYDTQTDEVRRARAAAPGHAGSQSHRRGDAGVREPVGFHPGGGRKLPVDLLAGPRTDGGGRHLAPVEIWAHRHPGAACAGLMAVLTASVLRLPGGDLRLSARAPVVAARPRAAPGDRAWSRDRLLEHGKPDALADGNRSVRTRPGRARVRRAGRAHQRPGRCDRRLVSGWRERPARNSRPSSRSSSPVPGCGRHRDTPPPRPHSSPVSLLARAPPICGGSGIRSARCRCSRRSTPRCTGPARHSASTSKGSWAC